MKILIVTDAWIPQTNGVVRTLSAVKKELEASKDVVRMVGPDSFKTWPCPTYPEIRLALSPARRLADMVDDFRPDAIHIATEGPLGLAARRYCLSRRFPFTTSLHTRFPEYVRMRFGVPLAWTYGFMQWFHAPAARVMAATYTLRGELEGRGFRNAVTWCRGVDTNLFRPQAKNLFRDLRPIYLYVGRLAVEKNLKAFLDLSLEGTKVVVGEGPQREALKRAYPHVRFPGLKTGEELARYYASSDVFVFPSRTDTFGLVLLEAMACGVPVAAFPVPGPRDVVVPGQTGVLDEDLGRAARRALGLSPLACRSHAEKFSWQVCAEKFRNYLEPFR